MKIKVCGMKYRENIEAVAALQPDYLGFIFYENSARNNEDTVPTLPSNIHKVGVFVDAEIDFVVEKVKKHQLNAIQLHGKESAEYCKELRNRIMTPETGLKENKTTSHEETKNIKIVKVFSIKDEFDFGRLQPFEDTVDFFLFDTKGKLPGGNGYSFNWEVLKNYPSNKPFFLSGGIGMEHLEKIKNMNLELPIHAIDVNSKFELEPGLKNVELLQNFVKDFRF
ncbi:phosphoribosylanthranilate isomerase [Galbibacter sp. BG1]|uniref:phosphoribosylanthranilate isomerase n=1 Tax=Galbibacter sp. BG1 TaxID=1170699 RepID=UPI0015BDC226|nr:phosphoribosylanthranilate isomerase [Galbibacter sp. BG1]QLE01663.1 phosphoribosylanthranilate isomerase [Galbibacter sp. BG1]